MADPFFTHLLYRQICRVISVCQPLDAMNGTAERFCELPAE
ncbi:hypothetical protein CGLO_07606 [Colletotrichum gloeosporioides Cg-14]|uniref:Uncharacterized protein n=1 Tax=Colletotrichum gloeosporioides (strain Cg-14) TaxID=1237896 RepID=T0KBK0_COLGC|nr:hypothetical protein CGLO_07606 [Colletotrichum gloeosporioides Cg-14]